MPLDWNDNDAWILRSEQPLNCCAPPYVGNGRLGLRLGALILGTDREAPPLTSAEAEVCREGNPPFDHSFPLQTFAAQVRDRFLYCLPSWANIDLRVSGQSFQPRGLDTSAFTTSLDLRTGEAALNGVWCCGRASVEVAIRLLIPRGRINGGFWELELAGLEEPAEITFGLAGSHLAGTLSQSYRVVGGDVIGTARTSDRGRTVGLGLRWQAGGADAPEISTNGEAIIRLRSTGSRLHLRVFHAVCGGTEAWDESQLMADLATLDRGFQDGSIRVENSSRWRELWADALDVTALPLDARDRLFLLAQQFYLLASYDGSESPTAPLGLSGNQWSGQMLWDTDLWHFRALNALWPKLARQPVRARLGMLPGAKRRAAELGLAGAWFGWMCDEEGNEIAPHEYQSEIHVNAWIALAAWESVRRSDDRAWQEEVFPLLSSIADATCSRAERDADGAWHIRKVVPPDESVAENKRNPGVCDDNVSTNLAFRGALRAAVACARQLGREPAALWSEVADGLVILAPGSHGIIPEYSGYKGHQIKQADLILAFWPLESEYAEGVILVNLDYYRERCGTGGPLMSAQIDACIRLRHSLGSREEVARDLLTRYRRHVRGAFEVPYECINNSNSLFLTGCGGLIQAFVHGWFDVRQPEDFARVPRLICA